MPESIDESRSIVCAYEYTNQIEHEVSQDLDHQLLISCLVCELFHGRIQGTETNHHQEPDRKLLHVPQGADPTLYRRS